MDIYELLNIPEKRNEIPFFLILDCIEDPGNVGAILGLLDAAGVHGVIVQEGIRPRFKALRLCTGVTGK